MIYEISQTRMKRFTVTSQKINQPLERWIKIFLWIFRSGGIVIDHVDHVGCLLCLWGLF